MSPNPRTDAYNRAIQTIAKEINSPLLYAANGKQILPSSQYSFRRSVAKRTGSMINWRPEKQASRQAEAWDREEIVARSIDLTSNDPHAAGVIDNYTTTVIGSGLTPHPRLKKEELEGYTKEELKKIQTDQKTAYDKWYPWADAGQRMNDGQIQNLAKRSMYQYGEYLVLLQMIKDQIKSYSLACQVIHPLRLKTPSDKWGGNIQDGIELGNYGEPIAYWIKKSDRMDPSKYLSDDSSSFMRVPVRDGHRWRVLHGFIAKDAEQIRGWPILAPAMKFFRDFSDLLDAELVSQVISSAFSMFIEVAPENDIEQLALKNSNRDTTETDPNGDQRTDRHEEITPGLIMYGQAGQKPHPISSSRPGNSFDPFTKIIKKAFASAVNLPYTVAFKDVSDTNFAGFRAAMLDAWRVFMMERKWFSEDFCGKRWRMLQEEAYLRGDVRYKKDFYKNMYQLTRCEWRGSPKGDIEPMKAVQSDLLAINGGLKTREQSIAEQGGDLISTLDQLQEEEEELKKRKLTVSVDGKKIEEDAKKQEEEDKKDADDKDSDEDD